MYFQGVLGPSTEKYLTLGNIAKIVENDTSPDDGGGTSSVIISLVNIEEDRISKNPDGKYRTHNSVIKRNPEILLNLYVLFSVNTGSYLTALSRISTVIQCFQSNNFFSRADFPTLDSRIEKLHLVSTNVTLPDVPEGLRPCQHQRVSDAINGELADHEQDHVAAFSTYNGTVTLPIDYTGCSAGIRDYVQDLHLTDAAARETRVRAASALLDPFHITVDLDCEDAPPPEEGDD